MGLTPARDKRFHGDAETEDYAGYRVFDPEGREIGRVKEVSKGAGEAIDHVEVGSGLMGLRSALIPVGLVAVDDENGILFLR